MPMPNISRSYAKRSGGDLDGAIADCDRAIELNPKLAKAFDNRGSAKLAKGDVVGAADDFAQAAKLAQAASCGSK